jgi:hypothetical protein
MKQLLLVYILQQAVLSSGALPAQPLPRRSNVSLEDLVPADYFYHHLERTPDLTFVRELMSD